MQTGSFALVISWIFLLLHHPFSEAFELASLSFISLFKCTARHRFPSHLASSDYDYYNYDEADESSTTPTTTGRGRRRVRPIRLSNPTAQKVELNRQEAQARHQQALQDPTLLTNVRFQERDDIHPATKRAIVEVMGLQAMTEIQSKTYAEALSGKSVLARSRTGTGKTLAFLIPSLERTLINDQRLYHPGRNVGILIVAPTRELALQISDTAKQLLTFHNNHNNNNNNNKIDSNTAADLSVLCLYGGTRIQKDIGLLNQEIPTILVCTPGRLQDHLEGTRLRGRKFSDLVTETSILVIDEMDAALQSFPREMKKILSYLPRSHKRQTLLFSATLPKKLLPTFQSVLPEDNYALVDCVAKTNNNKDTNKSVRTANDDKRETNVRVKQSYLLLDGMDSFVDSVVATVLYFMEEEKQQQQHKLMVFFPTARLVKFFTELFNVGIQKRKKSFKAFQMHSKMSQSARNRVRETFRATKTGVLFTTDVSARGLDYPEVSVVIQYGYPKTWEGYVHRVGRTGRAGYEGQGLLVLFPFEEKVTRTLNNRGLDRNAKIESAIERLAHNDISTLLDPARLLVGHGDRVLTPAAETAFLSLLAYYGARASALGLSGDEVLDIGKSFATASGLRILPKLSSSLLKDLKLTNTDETY